MRVKYLFIYFVCITVLSTAQNNLIILSEAGQKFFLFVDDKPINDSAQVQVKATKIYDDTCRIKVLYHNKNIPEFTVKVFLEENGKPVSKKDFTYGITQEKNKTRLKFISINFTQSDSTIKEKSLEVKMKTIFTDLENQKQEQNRLNEIYPAPTPCIKIISDSLLKKKLQFFKDNHIELNRMKDAKWFISHNCINTTQLKLIMGVFDYQQSKVKIAEFAYDYIEDHRNFLNLLDAVEFTVEKADLKKFYDKRIEK